MGVLERVLDDRRFQWFIIGVILFNAVILGLLTLDLPPALRATLEVLDNVCLAIFVVELGMKLLVQRGSFFRDGWNLFDLIVVSIAIIPNSGPLSVLRALRVLRVMRLATAVPSMRRVLNGMFGALPGGASVAGILFILYYVSAIIAVTLFRDAAPENFGSIGETFFTLFQLMTLEGWNTIAEKVMNQQPMAWMFFITFIVFTNFTTLNLLFGIIVDAMEKAKEDEVREELAEQGVDIEERSTDMRVATIENDVRQIREMLLEMKGVRAAE